jgi:hypothetical protein
MSSDPELERLLRDARDTLPEPDAASARRALDAAVAARPGPRPRRLQVAAFVGVAVAVAVVLGVGIGALVAPTGEAAKGPVGLGFLPQPGWYALQAEPIASPMYQTIAAASNVPFEREDDVRGRADASGLPYATLLGLPTSGIVIVAGFTQDSAQTQFGRFLPKRQLPLRIRDATPYLQYGTQVRPDQPLAQYQLQAEVNGHNVDIQIYFGSPQPSPELLGEAQSQLDRLVVRSPRRAATPEASPETAGTTAAPSLVDRTFLCTPALVGGVRQIDVRAHAGSRRQGASWDSPSFASVSTTVSGSVFTAIEDELVWVTAGRPSEHAAIVGVFAGASFPVRTWGTVGVNGKRCRGTEAIRLDRTGLSGGAAGPFDDRWDCTTGNRVLVRVRTVVGARAALKSYRGFLRTTVPVRQASLAVRTLTGKPLMYAEVFESGKSLLFTSPRCFPD